MRIAGAEKRVAFWLGVCGALMLGGCGEAGSVNDLGIGDVAEDSGNTDLPAADEGDRDTGVGIPDLAPTDLGWDPGQADVPEEDTPLPTDLPVPDEGAIGDLPADDGEPDIASEVGPDAPSADEGTDVPPAEPLEIAGRYTDNWGGTHDITSETWTMGGMGTAVFHIAEYDNETNWLVAQNDEANDWSPGLWSRMDWTVHDGTLYYCQTAFSAASRQEARDTPPPDSSDPAGTGCSGFPWSALTPWVEPLEIAGRYTDNWGGTHDITSETWTMGGMGTAVFHIAEYDNETNWLVAQNDEANDWSPGLWSRMDWTVHDGTLYYCQTAFSAASRQEARDTPPPDSSDPAGTGCSGFPWSALTPWVP